MSLYALHASLGNVVLRGPLCSIGATAGASGTPGARILAGVSDAGGCSRGLDGGARAETTTDPSASRSEPAGGAYQDVVPRHAGPTGDWGASLERAPQAVADRTSRGGWSAYRVERSLPLICNDCLGGLDFPARHYLRWLVTARVNSHPGN